jgi:hypothetical protein
MARMEPAGAFRTQVPMEVRAPKPAANAKTALTPRTQPVRDEALFRLSPLVIDVEGERFPVSPPQSGDVTGSKALTWRMTFGVAAADVPRLRELGGKTARLHDRAGRELLAFRIERVDSRLALIIAGTRLRA